MAYYDYKTRQELQKRFLTNWELRHPLKKKIFGKNPVIYNIEITNLLNRIEGSSTVSLDKLMRDNATSTSLSALFKSELSAVVERFVPKEYLIDYYHILDRLPEYQYTTGASRRSLRTKRIDSHFYEAIWLLSTYRVIEFYGVSVSDLIRNRLDEEHLDFKKSTYYGSPLVLNSFDDVIAARIDLGDREVIRTVKEALLSENNTVIVDYTIVRAILKSDNDELQDLLCKFLVAARLQEGVRQVICENADCGTIKSFMKILDTIERENLLRFAAVKRAVGTWTGICNNEHLDRLSDKVFGLIFNTVRDKNKAKELIESEDAVNINIGLWVLGFYEASEATDAMLNIVNHGSRNRRLAVSYYCLSIQNHRLAEKISYAMIAKYKDDTEIIAAFLPNFFGNYSQVLRKTYRREKNEYIFNTVKPEQAFNEPEKARDMYELLKYIYTNMPKKKVEFDPFIFPWYSASFTKGDILARMAVMAYVIGDSKYIDETCCLLVRECAHDDEMVSIKVDMDGIPLK